MNYVKKLDINGVETRLTSCIELHGAPNAATAAAVGVLGIDVDSPTHEIYKCVAVYGSIHIWEVFVSGGGNVNQGEIDDLTARINTVDETVNDLADEFEAKSKIWDATASSFENFLGRYADEMEAIHDAITNFTYEEISITSFGHDAGTKEYGEVVSSVNLSWETNKTPTTLILEGEGINEDRQYEVHVRGDAMSGLSITKDTVHSWKLTATDERGVVAEKTTSITFCNGIYHGAAAAPANYDSAFVLGLKKELRSNKLPSFTETAGAGQYIFYCLPVRMGTCTFKVGVFEGGFELVNTLSFTNASGYSENYYIYKSVNANLGETTVNVS